MTEFQVKQQIAECNRNITKEYASLRNNAKGMGNAAEKTAARITWLVIGGIVIITLLLCAIFIALEKWAIAVMAVIVGGAAVSFASSKTLGVQRKITEAKKIMNTRIDSQPKI